MTFAAPEASQGGRAPRPRSRWQLAVRAHRLVSGAAPAADSVPTSISGRLTTCVGISGTDVSAIRPTGTGRTGGRGESGGSSHQRPAGLLSEDGADLLRAVVALAEAHPDPRQRLHRVRIAAAGADLAPHLADGHLLAATDDRLVGRPLVDAGADPVRLVERRAEPFELSQPATARMQPLVGRRPVEPAEPARGDDPGDPPLFEGHRRAGHAGAVADHEEAGHAALEIGISNGDVAALVLLVP